jgi:TPP-dependent pyruvate/acetoin dehydrogenase alpha subunit
MLLVRLLEDELQKLCYEGEAGDLHFSKGQEAISIGVCSVLDKKDYMVTHHRTIAHSIAKGVPLKPLVAEILGKNTGVNRGMAGEMHIRYPPARYMFSFQLVGTCVPVAAGVAWAAKNYLKDGQIVACFSGDAASSNAQWNEGMNIAKVRQVPLLMICENNGLAGNIRPEFYLSTSNVAERARGFGIKCNTVDGNHLDELVSAAREALRYVRDNGQPFLLEAMTTRLCWHKQGQRDVRSAEELAELAKRDPLLYEEERQGISPEQKSELMSVLASEITEAVTLAQETPYPEFPIPS